MRRRRFIKISALGTLMSGNLVSCLSETESRSDREEVLDIVVVGATPAGIMAAIAAARLGSSVTLVEYHGHIGGMSTSGLGKSDIENKNAIAGLFKEFTERIRAYYVDKYGEASENVVKCKDGYYYEPSVAEQVFNDMVRSEKNIQLFVNFQLESANVEDDTISEVHFKSRKSNEKLILKGRTFVDATYEGDVFALAGAAYALGREGRDEFDEEHAGELFFDYSEKKILEGSTGKGDKGLPAYTYRLCLTDDPRNSHVLTSPPDDYDRTRYTGYFLDLKEGRLSGPKVIPEGHGYYAAHFDTLVRAFSFAEIPNRKYDVNINPRPLAFPFPEENQGYVEADWKRREQFFKHHKNLVLGLLYFLQNDSEVPEAHRKLANQYHLPKDEFTDNGHFPWQLYVREARRLKGKYVLTENDARKIIDGTRNTIFNDSIIAGEFPIDSFPVTKRPSVDRKVLEGYIGLLPISPYQIPYRILIPEKIKGLIVPVAASTTHVAYSTLRMEPLWMGLGQVAGTAAALALRGKTDIQNLSIDTLQLHLQEYNQILTYFEDVPIDDKAFKSVQFFGTKGFFESYQADCKAELSLSQWKAWHELFLQSVRIKSPMATLDNGGETVRILDFKNSMTEIIDQVAIEIDDADREEMTRLNHFLYEIRDENMPILRGEACMGYYALYRSLVDYG